MKIQYENESYTQLYNLKSGEIFIYNNELYMKTTGTLIIDKKYFRVNTNDGTIVNRLYDGELVEINYGELVKKVECEVIVKCN